MTVLTHLDMSRELRHWSGREKDVLVYEMSSSAVS
jgi:hypothetical protein